MSKTTSDVARKYISYELEVRTKCTCRKIDFVVGGLRL